MRCPHCNADYIEGEETCEECGASLEFLSHPTPSTPTESRIMRDRVRSLHPSPPVTVSPETTVRQVLDLLVERSIGCVLVTDGDRLLGIFSERDALLRLGPEASELGALPIGQFMTPNPETLKLEDTIAFALHKMDVGHYRHLPVMKDGRAVGIISIRDIIGYITEDLVPAD